MNDPTSWAGPWTAQVQMTRTDEPLYEYACHEGNCSMASSLSGARAMRAMEAREAAAGDESPQSRTVAAAEQVIVGPRTRPRAADTLTGQSRT